MKENQLKAKGTIYQGTDFAVREDGTIEELSEHFNLRNAIWELSINNKHLIDKFKQIDEIIDKISSSNHACSLSCENVSEPIQYHLLCKLMRVSEIVKGELNDKMSSL